MTRSPRSTPKGDRVDVFANADTSMVALLLAAEHPERVHKLCLVNPYPRFTQGPDYPYGLPSTDAAARLQAIHTPARTPPAAVDVLSWRLPAVAADPAFRAWWDAVGRRGASPRSAAVLHRLIRTADVRSVLERVTAPRFSWYAADVPPTITITHGFWRHACLR